MADNTGRRYALISSDAHAGADLLGYKSYLDPKLYDDFDAWAADFTEPWTDYDIEMMDTDDQFLRVGHRHFWHRTTGTAICVWRTWTPRESPEK